MDSVSIVIPTYNRHESLRRAVRSALAQHGSDAVTIEILVIDNSPDANARQVLAELGPTDTQLHYIHEPNTGVANARNTGVTAASGHWVAFLDDDEEAPPTWIETLVSVARSTGADAVFGPVTARAEGAGVIGALAPYFSRRIDRPDRADITDLAAYLGTNNSMFDRLRCLADQTPFATSLNETGGEDSLLLRQLVMGGRRFAWASGAGVTEWAAERRLNWTYIRKRKFLSGQIRVFVHHMIGPSQWPLIPLWMLIGGVQFLASGAVGLALRPFNREKSERALATAFGGLGKVLWGARFRPALYGTGLVS